jgi:hypothetical protein
MRVSNQWHRGPAENQIGDVLWCCASLMYINRRHARPYVSDDFVMRDVTTEMCDLRVFILRTDVSRMGLSHVVAEPECWCVALRCVAIISMHGSKGRRQSWTRILAEGDGSGCVCVVVGGGGGACIFGPSTYLNWILLFILKEPNDRTICTNPIALIWTVKEKAPRIKMHAWMHLIPLACYNIFFAKIKLFSIKRNPFFPFLPPGARYFYHL